MGRPTLTPDEARIKRVTILLTENEYQALQTIARSEYATLTSTIRRLVMPTLIKQRDTSTS